MNINHYQIQKPSGVETIIGQGNFSLKTAGDLAKAILQAQPQIEFGLAMNEASDKIVRVEGNNEELKKIASKTAIDIGAGHAFFIFFKNCYPAQILPVIKNIPTVCNIFVATGNDPLIIFIAQAQNSKAIIGAGDGLIVEKIENEIEKKLRYDKLKSLK